MFIKIVTTIEAIESWFVVGIVGDRVLTTVEDGAKRRGRRWTMALTLVIMAVPLQRGGGNDAVPLYDWTTTTIKDLKVGNGHTMVPGLAKDVDRDQWHRKFHTREAEGPPGTTGRMKTGNNVIILGTPTSHRDGEF
jgi:hypothetical protein